MPTKQIYVKEVDLPIYAKAEKYGTSLANVVVEALREYVKQQEEKQDAEGFAQIDLEVGRYLPGPAETSIKRFWGKQIAFYEEHFDEPIPEEKGDLFCSIYLTRKGKFVLWRRSIDYVQDEDQDGHDLVSYSPQEIAEIQILDELPDVPAQRKFFEVGEMWVPSELIVQARKAVSNNEEEDVEELDV